MNLKSIGFKQEYIEKTVDLVFSQAVCQPREMTKSGLIHLLDKDYQASFQINKNLSETFLILDQGYSD